ncbi:MAG: hypothetical protein FWE69_06895 [Clostridiales bacterium]|nr:hypothetical protein [Clostridiales bacterium]
MELLTRAIDNRPYAAGEHSSLLRFTSSLSGDTLPAVFAALHRTRLAGGYL